MLNRFECIGNLGKDPEIRDLNNNNKVCNLSIGVTEKWKNKATGEQQSKTEWVKAVIFSEGLIRVCSQYLKKGSKVYLSGKLQTRKWQSNGETKYATEIVLNGFGDQVIMLDSRDGNGFNVIYWGKLYYFASFDTGLYYVDTSKAPQKVSSKTKSSVFPYSLLQSVEDNKKFYSMAEIKGADNAPKQQEEIGWPSDYFTITSLKKTSL